MMSVGLISVACLLGSSLAVLEDAAALFQQRQSVFYHREVLNNEALHREGFSASKAEAEADSVAKVAVEADSSAEEELVADWPRLDPDVRGLRVTRLNAHSANGSKVLLSSTMKCDATNSCDFPWYIPFAAYFKISAPMGLSKTDYVVVNYNSQMTNNRSTYWGWFVPKMGMMTGKCHFCSSDCTYKFCNSEYELNITTPTILDTLWVCLGDTQKNVFLKKQIWFLPRPLQELALGGNLSFGIGLYNANGEAKADATYRMTVLGSEYLGLYSTTTTTTTELTTATLPSMAALDRSVEGGSHIQSLEDDMKPSVGMVDVMQEVFSGMTEGSRKSDSAASAARRGRWLSPNRVMTFNLSVKALSPGNNMELMFDAGCTNPGLDYSALSCRIPMDTMGATVQSVARIAFDAEPGANLSFAQQTRSNSDIMRKFPMYFQKLSIDAPLCGMSHYTRAKVSLFDGMPRLPSSLYKTPVCGSYEFSFSTGGPKPVDFLNYLDLLTPFAMEPTDDLLPWSKTVWLKLTDHTGAHIIDFDFSVGLEKAS